MRRSPGICCWGNSYYKISHIMHMLIRNAIKITCLEFPASQEQGAWEGTAVGNRRELPSRE